MKITYDPVRNIAYLRLKEESIGVETIRVSDEVIIDLSPDGKVYGIELLNANEQLPLIKGSEFIFTNESTGKTVTLPIQI